MAPDAVRVATAAQIRDFKCSILWRSHDRIRTSQRDTRAVSGRAKDSRRSSPIRKTFPRLILLLFGGVPNSPNVRDVVQRNASEVTTGSKVTEVVARKVGWSHRAKIFATTLASRFLSRTRQEVRERTQIFITTFLRTSRPVERLRPKCSLASLTRFRKPEADQGQHK